MADTINPTIPLPEYDTVVRIIKLNLQKPITAPKILIVIAEAVKYLAHVNTMTGLEKKDLILHAIKDVITSSDLTESDKAALIALVDTFGDITINTLVSFGQDVKLFAQKYCTCCRDTSSSGVSRDIDITSLPPYLELARLIELSMQPPIDAPKIITLVSVGVRFLVKFDNITGIQKKAMVIQCIRDALERSNIDKDLKDELVTLLDTFASTAIDLFVSFGRHTKTFVQTKCGCSIL